MPLRKIYLGAECMLQAGDRLQPMLHPLNNPLPVRCLQAPAHLPLAHDDPPPHDVHRDDDRPQGIHPPARAGECFRVHCCRQTLPTSCLLADLHGCTNPTRFIAACSDACLHTTNATHQPCDQKLATPAVTMAPALDMTSLRWSSASAAMLSLRFCSAAHQKYSSCAQDRPASQLGTGAVQMLNLHQKACTR
jgi:hypothetical protein